VKRILISVLIIAGLDFITALILIPESYSSFRSSHYYYHHGLLPNKDTYAQWGTLLYPIHTNSLGFTDSVSRIVEIDSRYTLLILGDSHSEGVGVPYNKTFSGILASELRNSGIDVLNASCISYSPKIEYLKAKYLIEEVGFIPDEIFVLIDISDLQNELVYENFNPETGKMFPGLKMRSRAFLKQYSFIYYMVSSIKESRQQQKFFETAKIFDKQGKEAENNNTYQLYSGFFSHFDDRTLLSDPQFHGVGEWYYNDNFLSLADKGIDLGQENIHALKTLCNDHGIKLTLSVHPWHSQILRQEPEDYYVKRWEVFSEEEGIKFINLFPLFINGENPVMVNKQFYIMDDNQWNESGHKKVAEYLLEFFNKNENTKNTD
jgi:hypothetical protein